MDEGASGSGAASSGLRSATTREDGANSAAKRADGAAQRLRRARRNSERILSGVRELTIAEPRTVAAALGAVPGARVHPDPPHTHQFQWWLPYPAADIEAATQALLAMVK
jgi:hypothetical protein